MRTLGGVLIVGLLLLLPLVQGAVPNEAPVAQETTILPFGIEDCTALIAVIKVPALRIMPYMPPGFIPRAGTGAGVASLAIEADRCARMTTSDGVVDGGAYGSIWLAANPPAALRDGPGPYYVGWEALLPDADRQALLAAAGFAVHQGHVSPQTTNGIDTGLDLEMEDVGTFAMTGAGVAPATAASGTVVQFNEATDGSLARWSYEWSARGFGSSHAGMIALPEGSWVAGLAGGNVVPVQFYQGVGMTYAAGSIEFPILNPAS